MSNCRDLYSAKNFSAHQNFTIKTKINTQETQFLKQKEKMLPQILFRNLRPTCQRFATMSTNPNDRQTILKELLENSATFTDTRPDNETDTWATLPYAEGTTIRRDQSKKAYRPKTDPTETSIILFPGQGSQFVGMAKNLVKFPAARDIYELANSVLK